ncbi:MAG: hypothetical protein DMG45_06050 [Acidobacteria bacterium]|nr:MAG: hypothetical protein DMG45_06050 [Acidobacteriota bacterium]
MRGFYAGTPPATTNIHSIPKVFGVSLDCLREHGPPVEDFLAIFICKLRYSPETPLGSSPVIYIFLRLHFPSSMGESCVDPSAGERRRRHEKRQNGGK